MILFMCNEMFVPTERMRAVCGADQRWSPDPSDHVGTCECPYRAAAYFCECTMAILKHTVYVYK